MLHTPSLDDQLNALADQVRSAPPQQAQQTLRVASQRLTDGLDEYIKEHNGQDYLTEDKRPLGVAITLRAYQTGEFHNEHLSLPWAGYAAIITKDMLDDKEITGDKAFTKARIHSGAGANTEWTGRCQGHKARIQSGALPVASVKGRRNFHRSVIEPNPGRICWMGEDNAHHAQTPSGYSEATTDLGTNNFRYERSL